MVIMLLQRSLIARTVWECLLPPVNCSEDTVALLMSLVVVSMLSLQFISMTLRRSRIFYIPRGAIAAKNLMHNYSMWNYMVGRYSESYIYLDLPKKRHLWLSACSVYLTHACAVRARTCYNNWHREQSGYMKQKYICQGQINIFTCVQGV